MGMDHRIGNGLIYEYCIFRNEQNDTEDNTNDEAIALEPNMEEKLDYVDMSGDSVNEGLGHQTLNRSEQIARCVIMIQDIVTLQQ